MDRFQPDLEASELERIAGMTSNQLDGLPFGAIRLDAQGKVLSYNIAEGKLAQLDPKRVIGRNFFLEVAPCTNVTEFAGRFRAGVAARDLHTVFPYVFEFPDRQLSVSITLYFHKATGTAWVLVRGGSTA